MSRKKLNYDKKTYSLLKKLAQKYKKNELSDIDIIQFNKLKNKEITAMDLEKERQKCKEDVFYFIDTYVYVKNKFENPDEIPDILKERVLNDKIKFKLYDIQKKLINSIINNNKTISVKSRQIGFTTTALAFSLQVLSFEKNKVILLFSKSEEDAKDTLSECKFMYDNLPFFVRRKVNKRNEKTLSLGNNTNSSYMKAQTSGKKSGRSQAATYLILDEAEFIDRIDEIQRSAQFTLSSTGGKAIILSTPYIYGSQFYEMVQSAKKGKNGFNLVEGHQKSIPQRDEKWYKSQCEASNQDKNTIKTELDMEQILPFETYFNEDRLRKIKYLDVIEEICGNVKQYYKKTKSNNYLLSVDCQEEGSHKNAITVYNLNKKRIEATLKTTGNIYTTLLELANYYKNEQTNELAKIIIERNRGFYLIKKFEENELSHLLLPNIKYNRVKDIFELDLNKENKPNKLGLVTTEHTRQRGLSLLSSLIHRSKKLPQDLIEECTKFVIKKGKPVGLDEDDLILATSFALLIDTVFTDLMKRNDKNSKLQKKVIKSYYNKSFDSIDETIKKHRNKMKKNIHQIRKRNHLYAGSSLPNASTLLQLKMLEELNQKSQSKKINKIAAALL